MKTVILTGFGPFGPYAFNPTHDSAQAFNGKVFGDRTVIGTTLPCTYDAWKELAALMNQVTPYAVISTGLSSRVQGMRIESTFWNTMQGKYPDANGYNPQGYPISTISPSNIRSKSAHKELLDMLKRKGIPAESSVDPDAFICNSLGYRTSLAARTNEYDIRNMFVHIPWTSDYQEKISLEEGKIFLDIDKYHQGLELLIRNI
ncbi:MAG: hypothetical protein V4478_03960 [Patescibacteria group bacterium]